MVKKLDNIIDPQLVFCERARSAVNLTNKAKLSLYKKSVNSGVHASILEEVYKRGFNVWNESFAGTPEQFAFDRVNSFIAGGFAADLDNDLMEGTMKKKFETSEKQSSNPNDPSARFVGTDSNTSVYAGGTPGQNQVKSLKRKMQIQRQIVDESDKVKTVKKAINDKKNKGKTPVIWNPNLEKPDTDTVAN